MNTVRFCPGHNTVLEIDALDEYTEQEILNYWYTERELNKITRRCDKQAAQWESGNTSKSDSFYRGLQGYTIEGEEMITAAIHQCIDAVMDEQEAQWLEDIDDGDRIAVVSEGASIFNVAMALNRAMIDELEAQRVYNRFEKKNKEVGTSKRDLRIVSKPVEEGDDHTSICPDRSHPTEEFWSDLTKNIEQKYNTTNRQHYSERSRSTRSIAAQAA